MSKIKVNKDNNPVIYKQDIIKDGKLTVVGVFFNIICFYWCFKLFARQYC